MNDDELARWFEANAALLEGAYLAGEQPWQQSGFGLHTPSTVERWTALRRPIADALDRSGSFLDIGCANGYLLECMLGWMAERGLALDPYGLDVSARLVALARQRLPDYADHFFVNNAWDWQPPRRFDFVRAELAYVPPELHHAFVGRLLDHCVAPGGALLLAEYRRRVPSSEQAIDRSVEALGFAVSRVTSGWWEGTELTRVAVVTRR
jgi:SAM-dependent methyltransferase